jgi:hypothetical protein
MTPLSYSLGIGWNRMQGFPVSVSHQEEPHRKKKEVCGVRHLLPTHLAHTQGLWAALGYQLSPRMMMLTVSEDLLLFPISPLQK